MADGHRWLRPCQTKWRADGRGHQHTCSHPDDSHTDPHLCECGATLTALHLNPDGPLLPDPDFEDPGIPERRKSTTAEATLGLVALIAGLELLQLAVLVGILTAVLDR